MYTTASRSVMEQRMCVLCVCVCFVLTTLCSWVGGAEGEYYEDAEEDGEGEQGQDDGSEDANQWDAAGDDGGGDENAERGALPNNLTPLSTEKIRGSPSELGNKSRANRRSDEQIQALEDLFKETKFPNEKQRSAVGNQIGLTEKQVNTWLSHRRQKEKKLERLRENGSLYVYRALLRWP
eukprot:8832339-Pyramimonas_sp.AAC.1